MKILLYGLNNGTEYVEQVIRPEHEMIGYTDSVSKLQHYNHKRFYLLDQISQISVDYIVITLKNKNIVDEIISGLINKYRIPKNKIIWFYEYYQKSIPWQKIDRVFKKQGNFDGLILGISHAAFGIHPDCLEGRYLNLAVSYQDIYI